MPLAHQMIVRQACLKDMAAIVAFSSAMALETEGRQLDQARLREGTRSLLTAPERGFFLVAERVHTDSPHLIGQLMITYEWSDWRNGVFWWVQSVYVDPVWRRHGVYRSLHNHVVAQAKADPEVCGIRLYVEQDNHTAKNVYEHVGLIPSSYEVYETDFVLVNRRLPM